MIRLSYMRFFPADFVGGTMHLTTAEVGAYMLLICAYWDRKSPLPDDDRTLATIAKCTLSEWSAIRSALAQCFVCGEGMWRHKRIDRELEWSKTSYEGKKKGAETSNESQKRKKNAQRTLSVQSADAQRTQSESEPEPYLDREREAEFPTGFPASEAEAVKNAPMHLQETEKDWIIATWNKAAGRGGADAKAVPIKRWQQHVASEWSYEQQRREKGKSLQIVPGPGGTFAPRPASIHTQIESVKAIILQKEREMPGMPNPALSSKEDVEKAVAARKPYREELKKLRTKLTELQNQAAGLN